MVLRRFWISAFFVVLALTPTANAQNWWTGSDNATESGSLQELQQKKKVYLNVVFISNEPEINAQQEQVLIRRLATRAIAAYKGLELVGTPDQAEMTISILSSQSLRGTASQSAGQAIAANQDPNLETPLEVSVFVRGAMQRNGAYRPRVVWTMSSDNIHGEPAPAAVFAIDGFIEQVKKMRGEKK